MEQKILRLENTLDQEGNPAGGVVLAQGLNISWQNGPLKNMDSSKNEPNGTFVETVIEASIMRLEFYQNSKFKCVENEMALASLKQAKAWLEIRTEGREARGVEGTHTV